MSAEGGFPNQTGDTQGVNATGGTQYLTLNATTLGITNGNSVVLPIPSPVVGFNITWDNFTTSTTTSGGKPNQYRRLDLPHLASSKSARRQASLKNI